MPNNSNTPLDELVGVGAQMIVDAVTTEVRAIGSTDQLDRRTYVRTVFALIEGVSFCQRNHVENEPLLTLAQRERARKAGDEAWKEGQRLGAKMKMRHENAGPCLWVRSAFAAASAAHEITNPLMTEGPEWERFKDAVEVRNRITHPKTLAGCMVSDDDVALVRKVHAWYQRVHGELLAQVGKHPMAPEGAS